MHVFKIEEIGGHIACGSLGVAEEVVALAAHPFVQDLGINSLSMMFMSLAVEEKFAFRFETQAPFETVGEVCEYIESRLK